MKVGFDRGSGRQNMKALRKMEHQNGRWEAWEQAQKSSVDKSPQDALYRAHGKALSLQDKILCL